jgi:hypothetical protein
VQKPCRPYALFVCIHLGLRAESQWHSACFDACRTPNAQRIRLLSDKKSGA